MGSQFPKVSDNALSVLSKRYFLKDAVDHPVEDVDEFFHRVVRGVFDVELEKGWIAEEEFESEYQKMYEMIRGMRFIPNSPCLMNSGKSGGYNQLAACFVLPIDDSLKSIKTTDMNAAIIHQSGGGTGFNFSKLRPRGDFVRSSGGVASGPVSFMSMIDYSCGEVKQGGTRRGANMGILNVDHPDILEFIHCKTEDGDISNFNISVGITDAFMRAVADDETYPLINPRTNDVHVKDGEECWLRAVDVWDTLVDGAWLNGEPGLIFLDRIEETNPTPDVAVQDTTNPCGEQPLLPYEACVLGSLNLSTYVVDVLGKPRFNREKMEADVALAIRFLDDMVEASTFPIHEITDIVKFGNRRVGLGVMGWSDVLYKMGIPYNSDEALTFAEEVMCNVNTASVEASEQLAAKRGVFPNFHGSMWQCRGDSFRRNATVTTIAPTGTISMIADCSSGIEPLFALVFWKNVMRDSDSNEATSLRYVNPLFEGHARMFGYYSDELMEAIVENHGSLQITSDTPEHLIDILMRVPEVARRVFVTSHDIEPEWHIRMQAAFQRYTENAVSKTINFPNSATRQDVDEGYQKAYRYGCKGVTVYRDGSRDLQVLTTADSGDKTRIDEGSQQETCCMAVAQERERPDYVEGSTTRIRTGCGPLFVTINSDEDGNPFELFGTLGKAGGCAAAQTEAIGRLVSLALRSGVPAEAIHKQLRGIICYRPVGFGPNKVLSCADAIAQVMEQRLDVGNADEDMGTPQGDDTYSESGSESYGGPVVGACSSCGGQLVPAEGCVKCVSCGFSECG